MDTLPAIASNLYIQGLKGELTALQRQLAQASRELGERHPDIIKLESGIQNAERKLQTETGNVVKSIQNDFQAAQSRERALAGALARQKAEVQALNGKSVEYTALEREANSNREALDKLLQRARETNIAKELQSTTSPSWTLQKFPSCRPCHARSAPWWSRSSAAAAWRCS